MKNFFAFEGMEYAGKTTQIEAVANDLMCRGKRVIKVREPGGTILGERLRDILKDPSYKATITPFTSMCIFNAARSQLMTEVVRPALEKGSIVLMDRSPLSTLVYQGHVEGINRETVILLCEGAIGGLTWFPMCTFFLDISLEEMQRRQAVHRDPDRYDSMGLDFHAKLREGYLEEFNRKPQCFPIKRIDGNQKPYEITADIVREIRTYLYK